MLNGLFYTMWLNASTCFIPVTLITDVTCLRACLSLRLHRRIALARIYGSGNYYVNSYFIFSQVNEKKIDWEILKILRRPNILGLRIRKKKGKLVG